MDIYCSKCGEPWDMDEAHDVAAATGSTWKRVMADFRANGCSAFDGVCSPVPLEGTDSTFGLRRHEAASALYDILGDDMDGAAAMLQDMGY